MAGAFDTLLPRFTAVYRASPAGGPSSHFYPYGLKPPRHTHILPCTPACLEWTHIELPAFRAFLRRHSSDTVVYTRSSRLSWAAVSTGLATYIELHDPLTPMRTAWLRHLLAGPALKGLIATTPRLRDDLRAALPALALHRILVAGNAGPASALTIPGVPLPLSHSFNIGYAGSAYPGKGIEILLACASLLPNTGFHIIGPSAAACARFGLIPRNVILHGYLPYPDVIGRLKSMDALLLPNQRTVTIRSGANIGAHTSPLKLFDYLSTGRPIIASDLPIFLDVLRNEENALLVRPEDPGAFCHGINRLHKNPLLGTRLGATAQMDFAAKHTWDRRAACIVDFISSTL